MSEDQPNRYIRQIQYSNFGTDAQQRLLKSRVLICGCGALGTTLANHLVRAGVGFVRLVDRDIVDIVNLHRQILFDEADAAQAVPKAVAAAQHLKRVNSQVSVESVVADVGPNNVHQLASDVDLILDGCDNFETRFLLNDFSLKQGIPWISAACLGTQGQVFTIIPGETPCLRCLIPEPPPPGSIRFLYRRPCRLSGKPYLLPKAQPPVRGGFPLPLLHRSWGRRQPPNRESRADQAESSPARGSASAPAGLCSPR